MLNLGLIWIITFKNINYISIENITLYSELINNYINFFMIFYLKQYNTKI